MLRRGLARMAESTPRAMTQGNRMDPDSHFLQAGGSSLQGFNSHLAVDGAQPVIVAIRCSNHALTPSI